MEASYGSLSSPEDIAFARAYGQKVPDVEGFKTVRKQVDWSQVVGSLFVPWLVFVFTFSLMSMRFHYDYASATQLLCFALLFVALYFGFTMFMAVQRGQEAFWHGFMFATCLLWWTLAFIGGNVNFLSNFEPVYDVNNLNIYPSVDPTKYRGNQLMDAGIIRFTPEAQVYLPYSMNFVNKDTYCAAPIISGNASMPTYDFWAIGKNCCGSKISDFSCGGVTNPNARSGLRLMNDNDRQFYRLVVRKAEASFKITATHPIFFYWMQEPGDEIKAYQEDGLRVMRNSICGAFVGQLLLIVLAIKIYVKT
mmetsp:Transcript_322/g.201  ORF Transcript_322/g.201 Transcript_322/m.201 type:complete len:307 (+) Transcript_322:112-1032(+)